MKRAVVALLVSVSMLGCFPHNPKARTYAQLGEGAAIVAGIAISAVANTGADCDEMAMPGIDDMGCHDKAKWLTTAGVVLIVGGLLGFVATVSTAEDQDKPKPIEIKDVSHKAEEKPATPKLTAPPPSENTQATEPDPNAAGSGATTPSAPQQP
jgi:hypothetical protein